MNTTIVYKKGKLNTNADALSRIVLNSDMLKDMIPTETNLRVNKTLIATRSMNKKNEQTSTPTTTVRTDQLYMWDCTSLNDVKNMRQLKFELDKEFYINIYKDIVHVGFSDKSANLDSEEIYIQNEKINIKELALNKYETIFNIFKNVDIKKAFNEIMKKEKSPQLKIITFKPPQRIVNVIEQFKLINEIHNQAHFGIRKTVIKLKQTYIWKNMNKMVKSFINKCDVCAKNKQTIHIKEPFTLTDTPTNSFETVQIDTVGPLRISNEYRYILTMQCELTKYIIAYPIKTKDAETIAKTMVEHIIHLPITQLHILIQGIHLLN